MARLSATSSGPAPAHKLDAINVLHRARGTSQHVCALRQVASSPIMHIWCWFLVVTIYPIRLVRLCMYCMCGHRESKYWSSSFSNSLSLWELLVCSVCRVYFEWRCAPYLLCAGDTVCMSHSAACTSARHTCTLNLSCFSALTYGDHLHHVLTKWKLWTFYSPHWLPVVFSLYWYDRQSALLKLKKKKKNCVGVQMELWEFLRLSTWKEYAWSCVFLLLKEIWSIGLFFFLTCTVVLFSASVLQQCFLFCTVFYMDKKRHKIVNSEPQQNVTTLAALN